MTVIAWDGRTLAADKRAVLAGNGAGMITKIFRVNGDLCAFSGDVDVGLQMVEWYRAGCIAEQFPQKQSDDNASTLLVITKDRRVLRYERTTAPLYFEEPFAASGSGRDYALAAMYLGYDARRAVEVACAFDVACGNGIDTLEHEQSQR